MRYIPSKGEDMGRVSSVRMASRHGAEPGPRDREVSRHTSWDEPFRETENSPTKTMWRCAHRTPSRKCRCAHLSNIGSVEGACHKSTNSVTQSVTKLTNGIMQYHLELKQSPNTFACFRVRPWRLRQARGSTPTHPHLLDERRGKGKQSKDTVR